MKQSWFQRNTGSIVRLAFSDCECHSYGRPHCFSCKSDEMYQERDPVFQTREPRWKPRYLKTQLTPADQRFLLGLPERKPFYPRRKRYDNRPHQRYS